ncbi:MAG: hypothetical protein ACR650_07805 [Methylocystis sp.]
MIQSRFFAQAFGALMLLGFEAAAAATPMAAAPSVIGLSASSGHIIEAAAGMERREARRVERRVHRYERRGERYAHRAERRAIRHGYY